MWPVVLVKILPLICEWKNEPFCAISSNRTEHLRSALEVKSSLPKTQTPTPTDSLLHTLTDEDIRVELLLWPAGRCCLARFTVTPHVPSRLFIALLL